MKTTRRLAWELPAATAAVLLIGWLDFRTGDELDLFALYFFPIAAVAWRVGRGASLAIAGLAVAAWIAANLLLGHAYSVAWMGWWGGVVMLGTFAAVALVTSGLRRSLERERELNAELRDAMAKIKRLSGRLPICMGCKSIRDSAGDWHGLEEYFTAQSDDDFIFSHTVCPHCKPRVGASFVRS